VTIARDGCGWGGSNFVPLIRSAAPERALHYGKDGKRPRNAVYRAFLTLSIEKTLFPCGESVAILCRENGAGAYMQLNLYLYMKVNLLILRAELKCMICMI
jgi:hypothetical protein